ncbi:MAG TPA: tyramine oxidase, partial [Ktedonobacteraceae bacterium]|nr:tyramine oxidase [Ktedonobacteraceae bacterium]
MTSSGLGETTRQQSAVQHPLDPLTADEITLTTNILKASGRITSQMRLMAYSLHEPEKAFILSFQPNQPWSREVDVVIRDHERHLTIEAVVSLRDGTIRTWHERGDVQPALTYPEVFAAQEAIRADPAFQAAMQRRGITDLSTVVLYPWTAGYPGQGESAAEGRLIRMEAALCPRPLDNYYAHPVEGVVATVELDTMTVRIVDHGAVPVPTHSGNYTPEGIQATTNSPSFPAGLRTDVKPISITQPEGVSFQVEGQQVSWQKWRFRVGFTPREGLVLHLLEYQDRGRWRPILYRASLSEMYVPYGDPTPSHHFKNVFDAGEVG